jgi:AbrB family looped-hinge helix DNA binding protein
MNSRLTIDRAGRVVIPKTLREELRLEPGDSFEMESIGERDYVASSQGHGSGDEGTWRLGISCRSTPIPFGYR